MLLATRTGPAHTLPILVLALSTAVAAQSQFEILRKDHLFPSWTRTQAIALGDVDGDGDVDMFAANLDGSMLSLNDGTGVFTPVQQRYSASSHDVVLADLDGDGDLDLFFANQGQNSLYINYGKGSFVASTALPPDSDRTEGVDAADLDGDGDLDLVLANAGAPNRIYINDGKHAFKDESSQRLPTEGPDATQRVLPVDVDGDGDLDLVLANFMTQNRLYLNNGKGVFQDVTTTALPKYIDPTTEVVAGDVDGDGDLDLVFGQAIYGNLQVPATKLYLNNGKGQFTDVTAARLPVSGGDAWSLAFGDVDGDGDLDLVLANSAVRPTTPSDPFANRANLLFLNDGKGKFTDASKGRLPEALHQSTAVVLADLDGDRTLDLVFGNDTAPNQLYLGRGDGSFADATGNAIAGTPPVAFVEDLDGDGAPDLITTQRAGPAAPFRLFLNDGKASFAEATRTGPPFDQATYRQMLFLDADGDGDTDILTVRSGKLTLLLNSGNAVFVDAPTQVPQLSPQYEPVVLVPLDLEKDGDIDVFYGSLNDSRVLVNDGKGKFTDGTSGRFPASTQLYAVGVVAADVDGDGDQDLAGFAPAKVFLNDGKGRFSELKGALPANLDGDLFAGDFDRDGDPDLLSSGYTTALFTNDGKGRFSDVTAGHIPTNMRDVTSVVDIDLDGDLDALGRLGQLFLNDGFGGFFDGSKRRFPGSVQAISVDGQWWPGPVADFDLDGDSDILFSAASGPLSAEMYLLVNLHRHVLSPWILRLGRVHRLEFYSRPGYAVGNQFLLPMLATGVTRTPLPPFGTLWLTPSSLVPLPPMLVNPSTGNAVLSLPIPATRSLLGTTLASQALILDGLSTPAKWRLTNVVTDRLDF